MGAGHSKMLHHMSLYLEVQVAGPRKYCSLYLGESQVLLEHFDECSLTIPVR